MIPEQQICTYEYHSGDYCSMSIIFYKNQTEPN